MSPLLSITFPQRFRKSKKFGYLTLGSWGKNTCKQSEQMKKKIRKDFKEQKFSNLRPLLFISFPQGFRNSKKFAHWTLKAGQKDH